MTAKNQKAVYACVNLGEIYVPKEIEERSICINGDIRDILRQWNKKGQWLSSFLCDTM